LALVEIMSPASAQEWSQARRLVKELFRWLEDASGVSAAEVQGGAEAELDALPWLYVPPLGSFLIAAVNGDIVGTAAVHLRSPDVAELKRVYVKPAARGLGIASLMLDTAMRNARDLGATRMVLESHREIMSAAVGLYRRHGFYEIPDYTDLAERIPGVVALERLLDQ
jgi:GNAT superfamily N-acetyltransferase